MIIHDLSYQDFSMGPLKLWPFVSEPGSLRPLPLLSLTVISVPVTQPRDFTPLSPPENQSFPQHSGPTVQALFQLTWHSPFVFLDETWPCLLRSSSAVLVLLCTLISVDTSDTNWPCKPLFNNIKGLHLSVFFRIPLAPACVGWFRFFGGFCFLTLIFPSPVPAVVTKSCILKDNRCSKEGGGLRSWCPSAQLA